MAVGKYNRATPRARLSEAEKDRITELADQGYGSARIGREIGRADSAVQWFLYRTGLRAPSYGDRRPYRRSDGRLIVPFSPEEDSFLTALRVDGLIPAEIARRATERFGHIRTTGTVRNRLVMLAARDELAP